MFLLLATYHAESTGEAVKGDRESPVACRSGYASRIATI